MPFTLPMGLPSLTHVLVGLLLAGALATGVQSCRLDAARDDLADERERVEQLGVLLTRCEGAVAARDAALAQQAEAVRSFAARAGEEAARQSESSQRAAAAALSDARRLLDDAGRLNDRLLSAEIAATCEASMDFLRAVAPSLSDRSALD